MKTSASVLFSVVAIAASANAGELWVSIDHARVHEVDQPIGSIIIGNPAVADVTVKSPTEIILFGVTPGSTNVSLYTADGDPIDTLSIAVRNPSANRLTLQSGTERYTFACTNVCEQVPAIGDGSNFSRLNASDLGKQSKERLASARDAANGIVSVPMQPSDPYPTSTPQPAADGEESSKPGS